MKAMDLANYIINKSIDLEKPISNLQLQKILYFVNLLYLHDTKSFLINENEEFQAWRHGPVIPDVYRKFAINGGVKIYDKQEEVDILSKKNADGKAITKEALQNIDNSIDYLVKIDPWDLVKYSHAETGAWINTYIPDRRVTISRDDIRKEADA